MLSILETVKMIRLTLSLSTLIGLLVLPAQLHAMPVNPTTPYTLLDRTALVINGIPILESELQQEMRWQKLENPQLASHAESQLRAQAIAQMVRNVRLDALNPYALRAGELPDELVLRVLSGMQEPTQEALEKASQQVTLSAKAMKLSRKQFMQQSKKRFLRGRTLHELSQQFLVAPSKKAIEDLAAKRAAQAGRGQEYQLHRIDLALPENVSEIQLAEKKTLAAQILSALEAGASFSELAVAHSSAPKVTEDLGAMGWVKADLLPSMFAAALQDQPVGSVVGPIQTGIGLHILRLDAIKASSAFVQEEYHLRHLLLQPTPLKDAAATQAQLQQLKADILNGSTTFAAAAKSLSSDLGSAINGGELPWSTLDQFDTNFANAAMTLSVGEISPPVQSAYGWHLIQLLDRRKIDRTTISFEEEARQDLFTKQMSEAIEKAIHFLGQDVHLEILSLQTP